MTDVPLFFAKEEKGKGSSVRLLLAYIKYNTIICHFNRKVNELRYNLDIDVL